MTLIYLACPYTHPDPAVRQARYEAVTQLTARLMRDEGRLVYSPITYTHDMCQRGLLPVEFEFYRAHARRMIDACDVLWVFCLDGWEESVGVREELVAAGEYGKPVHYHFSA